MSLYFCYEMTPLPAALFKHSQTRKPNKVALGQPVTKNVQNCRKAGRVDGACAGWRVAAPPSKVAKNWNIWWHTVDVHRFYAEWHSRRSHGWVKHPSTTEHKEMATTRAKRCNIFVPLTSILTVLEQSVQKHPATPHADLYAATLNKTSSSDERIQQWCKGLQWEWVSECVVS